MGSEYPLNFNETLHHTHTTTPSTLFRPQAWDASLQSVISVGANLN